MPRPSRCSPIRFPREISPSFALLVYFSYAFLMASVPAIRRFRGNYLNAFTYLGNAYKLSHIVKDMTKFSSNHTGVHDYKIEKVKFHKNGL